MIPLRGKRFRAQRGDTRPRGGTKDNRRGRGRRICGRGPQDERFRPPGGRTVGPTISFLEREGAAWRYQRKIAGARKHFCLHEAEMCPGTPQSLPGSALTQPKFPVQKEGAYGGTWFPRQIARGPRCGAALRFRRSAAIVGVQGAIQTSSVALILSPAGAFSLGPLQRPILFSREKRLGVGSTSPWEGKRCGLWPQNGVRPRLWRE